MSVTRLAVRVTPRAGRDRIDGVRDGVLRVRVAAPPVEGRANEALVRLLAQALGVAPRDVRVVRGAAGRDKLVEVEGPAEAEVRRRLGIR
jgi:uncharacterized protein (TIGR00251 family)